MSWDEKPVVLVVDDSPENLTLVTNLLNEQYRVKAARNGRIALKVANTSPQPDLILLDVMMPEMDGYEVCQRLKQNPETRDIPVIFLTARSDAEDEQHGLSMGAVDYITKPISPAITLERIRNHLSLKAASDFLKDKAEYLESEVAKRTQQIRRQAKELEAIQEATILVVTSLAETRDLETGNHIQRTQYYIEALANHLRDHPKYANELTPEIITAITKSAPLHDIGKVGIPDSILLKPGKLTDAEFDVMKTHASLGLQAIERAEKGLGIEMGFLRYAKEIAGSHHEKWDGSGYPQGLAGDDIPLAARLMAIADVYDALISKRVYKQAMSHRDAMKIMLDSRGTHFDPDMFDAFVEIQDQVQEIARTYADTDEETALNAQLVV